MYLVIPFFFCVFQQNTVSTMKVRSLLKIPSVLKNNNLKSPSFLSHHNPLNCFIYTSAKRSHMSEHSNNTYFSKVAYTLKQKQGRTKCHQIQNIMLFVFEGNYENPYLPMWLHLTAVRTLSVILLIFNFSASCAVL